MSSSYVFKQLTSKDLNEVYSLYEFYHDEKLTDSKSKTEILSYLENSLCFGAFYNDGLVAYQLSSSRTDKVICLENSNINPCHVGGGIQKIVALILFLKAKVSGYEKSFVLVYNENSISKNNLEEIGYKYWSENIGDDGIVRLVGEKKL